MFLLKSIRTLFKILTAAGLLLPLSASASVVASDNFQVPPYAVGTLAGQAVGGSGFKGSWTSETGLTQDLAMKSNGVIGRPAVPNGSAGDIANFASPISLSGGQFFAAYSMSNPGGSTLSSTRIDLNFGTSAPFTNYRVLIGGIGANANFNIWVESALTAANTAVTTTTTISPAGNHRLVGVLDVQNHKVALFVDPTSSSYYKVDGTNNATVVAPWTPSGTLNLSSYSLVENTGDNVTFSNVVFANDPGSVGLQGGASSGPTPISLTTTNGTVPGTSITYTISNTGGTPRNIFPSGTSDQNLWSWTSFPEFLAAGTPISLAVTFSAPIPANRLVWGANSVTPPSATKFTPSGGTASAADFNLTDGISAVRATGPASYNASTGTITANSQDVSLMVGSASTNTLTSFTISATNNSTDGYTVFFGFTAASAGTTSGGAGSGNITDLRLEAGSFSGGSFSPAAAGIWDTPVSGNWALGVSLPNASAPLLNNANGTLSGSPLAPGSYYIYSEPVASGLGTAVRITVWWSNGAQDQAVFAVGSLTTAAQWTLLAGTTNISLSSTGILTADKVGPSTHIGPSGVPDNVLELTAAAGSGSGSCTFSLNSTGNSVGAGASTGSVNVTAASGCAWTAVSNASWITIGSGASGNGNGFVTYQAATNTGASRTGTITIAGQTFTLTQVAAASGSCTYFLEPQSVNFPAAGGSGTIIVGTQAGCAVNAASNVSWTHILASSATAVTYQVDATNSSSTQRTGAITIANGAIPVTQDGVAVCTYSLSPPANAISALGGSDSVRLTTPAGCPWTAAVSPAGSWFHLTSASTGTAGANLSYKGDANTSSQSRSASITVSGATFTLTQAAGAAANAPVINAGGIENAASSRSGTIARGSYFAIYGANLGPSPYQTAPGFPLPDTLGGVVVTVSQGSYNKRAYLNFVYTSQINAILPSDAPLGSVQITVSYNNVVGASFPVTVVNTQFGTFSVAYGPGPGVVQNFNSATDVPLNTASQPLKPGQIAIVWGTGLGPITTGDNAPPPGGNMSIPVQVSVGGVSANILYTGRAPGWAGVDNVYFNVPANAPTGCSVPVQVTAAGTAGNTFRVAISSDGSPCQDTANPFANTTSNGGNTGTLGLVRMSLLGVLNSTEPPVDSTFDVGLGIFSNTPAGGVLAFSPFMNLPPVGTCVSTSKMLDLGTVIGSSGLSLDNSGSKSLDAGTALTVTGPKGSVQIPHFDPNSGTGPYVNLLGGKVPVAGSISLAPFLEPGSYTITGPGGKDIVKFSASLNLATPLNWTNQSQITSINRSAGVTVTWSGGDPNSTVLILGGSTDQQSKNSGGFSCLAPISAGTFTVPSNVLMDLPPTGAVTGIQNTIGMIALGALPLSNPTHFTASFGLTNGLAVQAYITVLAVPVQ